MCGVEALKVLGRGRAVSDIGLKYYVQHRWHGYQVMKTKSNWLKAFCDITSLHAIMLQEADTVQLLREMLQK